MCPGHLVEAVIYKNTVIKTTKTGPQSSTLTDLFLFVETEIQSRFKSALQIEDY